MAKHRLCYTESDVPYVSVPHMIALYQLLTEIRTLRKYTDMKICPLRSVKWEKLLTKEDVYMYKYACIKYYKI